MCCFAQCCQRAVASNCSGELEEAKGNAEAEAALRAAHPRFDALQEQYGPMTGAAAPTRGGTALSASMLEVHLVCVAPSAGKKMGRQTKKVPGDAHSNACFFCSSVGHRSTAQSCVFTQNMHIVLDKHCWRSCWNHAICSNPAVHGLESSSRCKCEAEHPP